MYINICRSHDVKRSAYLHTKSEDDGYKGTEVKGIADLEVLSRVYIDGEFVGKYVVLSVQVSSN